MQRLWQGVIVQAIRDALRTTNGRRDDEDLSKVAARDWLEGRSADFHHVCALAGVEPETVSDWWRSMKQGADQFPTLTQLLNERRKK